MKLGEAVKLFFDAGVPDPTYDAREIFMRIGGLSRTELISPNVECSSPELIRAVERRAAREPLQYIIGDVGFYRETYRVTPDVLIPRADTEHLVDFAVNALPRGAHFLDLCTGSGCVAISTLKNTEETTAVATDISSSALSVADFNSKFNGVSERIEFVISDALSERVDGVFDAVISNPPYVTEEAYAALEREIYFEPKAAFTAEDSGLVFYKKIISLYRESLAENGFFAFEIGYDQGDGIREIAAESGLSCRIIKDYSGCDRVAVLK